MRANTSAKVYSKPQRPPPRSTARRKRAWYGRRNKIVYDDGSRLELKSLPETVLFFSCTQAPFHHPDTLAFLRAVKRSYQPDLTVCGGDELDLQHLKKAFMGADSPSPCEELREGKKFIRQLGKLFPKLILLTSNHVHGRRRYAQAQGNIPTPMMREWRDVIDAPGDWHWRDYVIARNWLFEHGHDISRGNRSTLQEQTVLRFGRPLSIIRGHVHSELGDFIKPIWVAKDRQLRLVYCSSLMDSKQCRYTRAPTVNGCVVLIRGVPHPVPMLVNKRGRWTGELAEW